MPDSFTRQWGNAATDRIQLHSNNCATLVASVFTEGLLSLWFELVSVRD
jgi:hypothetical protein